MVKPISKKAEMKSSETWTIRKVAGGTEIIVPDDIIVYKDVNVHFEEAKWTGGHKRVFSFWFHTGFVSPEEPLIIPRKELDKIGKKKGGDNFFVKVHFEKVENKSKASLQQSYSRKLFTDPKSNPPEFLTILDLDTQEQIVNTMQLHLEARPEVTGELKKEMLSKFAMNEKRVEELLMWLNTKKNSSGPLHHGNVVIPRSKDLSKEQLVLIGILLQFNIQVRNRIWENAVFQDTFVGCEAAAWLGKLGFETEKEIIHVGSQMLKHGFFTHVDMTNTSSRPNDDEEIDPFIFRNTYQFYRFCTAPETTSPEANDIPNFLTPELTMSDSGNAPFSTWTEFLQAD